MVELESALLVAAFALIGIPGKAGKLAPPTLSQYTSLAYSLQVDVQWGESAPLRQALSCESDGETHTFVMIVYVKVPSLKVVLYLSAIILEQRRSAQVRGTYWRARDAVSRGRAAIGIRLRSFRVPIP
jgi:hypothetical protein